MNIWPIVWREVKIEFYNVLKFATYFVSPILIFLFFATIFSINNSLVLYQGKMIDNVFYLLPGILTLQVFFLFTKAFATVRVDELTNVIRAIAISKTNLFSYYEGKLLANTILTIVRLIILSFIAWIIFGISLPLNFINLLLVLFSIVAGSCIWFSIGFICGIFIMKEASKDFIFSVVSFPLTFASSVYYSLDRAPSFLKSIAAFNPLTYNCNLLRYGFLGSGTFDLYSDLIIICIVSVLLFLSSVFFLKFLVR